LKKPELLIPAGSLENLEIAVLYGADAVYIGGEEFGLRAKAKNFSSEEMAKGINYAHSMGVKVYVTSNIIAHNRDLDGVGEYFEQLNSLKPDGVIIADPGILSIALETLKGIDIHLSTQANNTNYAAINFWAKQGVKRVVVARELSFEEIGEIKEKIPKDVEIEAFVHGAMCISYSGRCLLSNYMANRDANQGACAHPCRWTYHLVEETRPLEYMPVYENERGTYIYNSKDLCMVEHIEALIQAGIDSFKIEGRMKTALYVATVTSIYRKAIDDYFEDPETYQNNKSMYLEELKKCSYRKFTTGFYTGKPSGNEQIYDSNTYIRNYTFVGKVLDYNKDEKMATIQQRNKFVVGDQLELMKKDGETYEITIDAIYNEAGESVESAPHPKEILKIPVHIQLEKNEILRKRDD
jgi:putative protease